MFIDANVLVEIALERQNLGVVKDFLSKHPENNYVSALTVHLTVHFGKKHAELDALEELISDFTVYDLTGDDIEWAFRNIRNDDFEDALQIAVAVRNGCDVFVTLDQKLAHIYRDLPNIKISPLS